MADKIRKIIEGKVQWFGTGGQVNYESPMLTVNDTDSYIESYKYRIYNLLNIIKGELKDKTYGISGVFAKQTKDELDMEIRTALQSKLDLTVSRYVSTVMNRQYSCNFTVVTPRGDSLSLEVTL